MQDKSFHIIVFLGLFWLTQLCYGERAELFSAEYKGRYSGMTITSVRTLTDEGQGNFLFKSSIKNFLGNITEKSLFSFSNQSAFIPRSYVYQSKIFGKASERTLSFDWQARKAEFVRSDKPEKNMTHSLTEGMLDLSLYQLKLQRDLANQSSTFDYVVVKSNKIKKMAFEISGEETLKISNKDYNVVRLQLINLDDDKKTTIWVAPQLIYQIVRVQHQDENGDSYQINLSKFNANQRVLKQFYGLPLD